MKPTYFLTIIVLYGSLPAQAALPLTESTFTEIIQEVNVVAAADKTVTPARTNELFKAPDLVRTGQSSRVELTAKDHTITRIGANTTFTFEPGKREIQLKKGSVLFHSPAGAGGGSIKSRGSSAAVLGTTVIGAVLQDNRFKVLNLEGSVKVTLADGFSVILKPGQTVTISADGTKMGDTMHFNLGKLAASLQLVVGFTQSLSSKALIEAAIQQQNRDIADGKLGTLASIEIAGTGLDVRYRGPDDPSFYSFNALGDGNPLDFPGMGSVSQMPHGTDSFGLLSSRGFSRVINPPPLTDVDSR